jgi:osmoprotectant transport system substrate-binding protein
MLKRKLLAAAAAGLIAGLTATVALAETLVVGGKNFTEQHILAEMTAQLLEAKGFEVDRKAGMGSAVLRQAQESGQIDLYWEYTGTSLITYNKVTDRLSAEETYAKVKELDAAKGLVWLDASKANNTYALAMNKTEADKLGIASLSDLSKVLNDGTKLSFASNAEFYSRPDGLKPLQAAYGFEFGRSEVKRMDSGLVYQALKDKQVDVGLVFATDGRIPAFNFVVLTDDKAYFPAYALTPVVRKDILDKPPELTGILNTMSAKLDDATMAALNASVDVEKKTIEQVSQDFLKAQGLI